MNGDDFRRESDRRLDTISRDVAVIQAQVVDLKSDMDESKSDRKTFATDIGEIKSSLAEAKVERTTTLKFLKFILWALGAWMMIAGPAHLKELAKLFMH